MKQIKKIDIFAIIICFILYGYSIFIGSPIKNNTNIINLVVLTLFIIYILVNIIKNRKYKVIRNSLDIFIIILVFSSYISLIFKNYANLESTIEYIIKYTTILSIYIMIRDIVQEDKKYANYIINTLIISGITIFMLGLDNFTFNYSERFIQLTKNVEVQNIASRFLGIFGYANTTGIYMLVISILAIGRNLQKERILYNISIFFSFVTIVLSYSRATWLIAIFVYLIYIYLARSDRKKYIELLLRIGIISAVYSTIAVKLINQKEYFLVWILLAIFILIVGTSVLISKKTIKIIEKINLKKCLIIVIILIICIVTVIIIGLNMPEPLVMFDNVNKKEEPTQDVINVTPNTTYKFEFEIEAKTAYNVQDLYKIEICERNKYDDIIKVHEIKFGTYTGNKTIEFTTTEYTYKFLLRFNSANRVAQRGLTITNLKINGKDKPLKYKILPQPVVEKISDISLKTLSVTQRFDYIKNACKLISKYGILGIGADGWKDRQYEVQEYLDFANEPHSYILEVFSEFGIIGFIAVICIIIKILYSFIEMIKSKQYDILQISIILAVLILFIHSCIDFELSFMYMLIVLFTLIAMIETKNKDYKYIDIFMKIIIIIFVIISIYFSIRICVNMYIKHEENPYSVEYAYNNQNSGFSTYIDEIVERRKYVSHVNLFEQILNENNLNESEVIKLYEVIKNENNISRNDVYEKINRINFYQEIILKLADDSKYVECKQQIIQEIEEIKELLINPEKCRLSFEEIENCSEIIEDLEKEVKEIK